MPLTPTEQLLDLAIKHKLDPEGQIEIIRCFDDGIQTADQFTDLAACLDEELTAAAAPEAAAQAQYAASVAGTLPQTTSEPPPVEGTAEMNAFFDRSLAMHSLKGLVQLPSDGAVFERPGYDTARIVVPKIEYTSIDALLDGAAQRDDPPGTIFAGWYHIFADGSIGAIAIVNASRNDGGPYVDAFLIIQGGVHITVPNPSLPPRRALDEDFVFPYPDGTYKLLKLVPSLV